MGLRRLGLRRFAGERLRVHHEHRQQQRSVRQRRAVHGPARY
jgi:hypothetical protein